MAIFEKLPYTNYHNLNADWIVKKVKEVAEAWTEYREDMDEWKVGVDTELQTFYNWFDNLDLTDEVRTIIEDMVQDGSFMTAATPVITEATEDWLAAHISQGYAVDNTLTISGAAADAKVTGDKITQLKDDLTAVAIHPTVSGSIASFTDGAEDVPMKSLVVNIEPVQSGSGDPSPTNVRPISGWTEVNTSRNGINQWDEEWEIGSLNANGLPVVNPSRIRAKNFIPALPSTTYFMKIDSKYSYSSWLSMHCYDENKVQVGTVSPVANNTFTTVAGTRFMKFNMSDAWNGQTYDGGISINHPSSETEYYAYTGNTYTTALGQTVYGGKLDVVSGELVIDTATTRISSFVGKSGFSNVDMGYTTAYDSLIDSTGLSRGLPPANFKCNIAKTVALEGNPSIQHGDYDSEVVFTVDYISAAEVRVSFPKSMGLDTLAKLNQYLVDHEVYFSYRTKTKTTVQLTAQEVASLLADNNVFANAGSVDVTYLADGKLYIDNRIAELQALILEQ